MLIGKIPINQSPAGGSIVQKLFPLRYLANLTPGRTALWCYLIWYLVTVATHFDPSPRIWLSSVGISAIVGVALLLSVAGDGSSDSGKWQKFRLFLMPFCVSSFSALIKDQGYILIFPPQMRDLTVSVILCAAFALMVFALKRIHLD